MTPPPKLMSRAAIDHMLRAAGAVTGSKRFVLVGAAAIIASSATVPDSMATTGEIDIYALDVDDPDEVAFELDGSLGRDSQFHETHGYHVDGVEPGTAWLPPGWRERASEYTSPSTEGVTAIVPAPDDIAVSKLAACRPKDLAFLSAGIEAGLFDIRIIEQRARDLERAGAGQRPMNVQVARLLGLAR